MSTLSSVAAAVAAAAVVAEVAVVAVVLAATMAAGFVFFGVVDKVLFSSTWERYEILFLQDGPWFSSWLRTLDSDNNGRRGGNGDVSRRGGSLSGSSPESRGIDTSEQSLQGFALIRLPNSTFK